MYIVTEWVTMRGHSLRGKYMEEYRKIQKDKKADKALRETMKRKESEAKQQ